MQLGGTELRALASVIRGHHAAHADESLAAAPRVALTLEVTPCGGDLVRLGTYSAYDPLVVPADGERTAIYEEPGLLVDRGLQADDHWTGAQQK